MGSTFSRLATCVVVGVMGCSEATPPQPLPPAAPPPTHVLAAEWASRMVYVPALTDGRLARSAELMPDGVVRVNDEPSFVIRDGRELRRSTGELLYTIRADGKLGAEGELDGVLHFEGDDLIVGDDRLRLDASGVVSGKQSPLGKFTSSPKSGRTAMLVVLAFEWTEAKLQHARLVRETGGK